MHGKTTIKKIYYNGEVNYGDIRVVNSAEIKSGSVI
jgi:hypothetical protein